MSEKRVKHCDKCNQDYSSEDLFRSHLEHGCCDRLRQGFLHSCSHCDDTVRSFADSLFEEPQ